MARSPLDDVFRNMGLDWHPLQAQLTHPLPDPDAPAKEEEDPYRRDDKGDESRWLLSVKYDVGRLNEWGIGDFAAIAASVEKMLPNEVNNPNRFAKTCCTVPDKCGLNWPADYNTGRNEERYKWCWHPDVSTDLKCTKCVERGCLPSTKACWKSSYFWRLSKSRKMLQIKQNGKLGDGQKIEEQMARFLGAEIRTVEINWDPDWESATCFGTPDMPTSAEYKINAKNEELFQALRAAGFDPREPAAARAPMFR